MKVLSGFLFAFILISCSSKSEEGMLESIREIEDKLREMTSSTEFNQEEYKKAESTYIVELTNFYNSYPQSEKAPECLDKVHMVYSGTGDFYLATKWADTLLEKYPKYPNRALVLESQGSTFDAIIEPRDSAKVRKYYSQLLNEFPNLDKDKREGIESRLKNNSMTFDQYIIVQMKNEAIGE